MSSKKGPIFIIKRIWNKIRYGMVLHVLRDYLVKIGIEITPYYLMREQVSLDASLKFEDGFSEYTFGSFGPEEMKVLGTIAGREFISEEYLLSILNEGKKCYGIKHQGQVAAFTWFDLKECPFKGCQLALKDNEAYLFDMYTLKPFRGKGLAPYLRYQSYKALGLMGIDTCYSITIWFNKPSIQFKKKLKAEFMKLGLNIEMFGKYRWYWTIKNYV